MIFHNITSTKNIQNIKINNFHLQLQYFIINHLLTNFINLYIILY